ncbi:MAG: hypothetical protein R3231_10775, partial [bacterium]|nr:hypothetical protein [bacterium]
MAIFSFNKNGKDEKQKNKIIQKAQKLTRKGQIDKAIAEWESLLTKRADDANIHNTIGDLYLKDRKKEAAIEAYRNASRIYRQSGFSLKAIAVNKKILKIDPMDLDSLLCVAQLNQERGMINNAKECYLSIAQYHLKTGAHEKALEAYQNIVEMEPKNLKVKLGLGELYLKEQMIAEGVRIYSEVIGVLLERSKFDESQALCEKLAARSVPADDLAFIQTKVYLARGMLEEGERCLQGVKNRSDEDPEIALLLAEIEIRRGRGEAGMEIIRKLDRRAITEASHLKIFRFLLQAGEVAQAVVSLDELFDAYAAKNRFEELLGFYQEIVDQDANQLRARQKVIDLLKKLKRETEMVSHLKEMGRIYVETGQEDAAKNLFEKLLEMNPGDLQVQMQLDRLCGKPIREEAVSYGEVDLESTHQGVAAEEEPGNAYVIDDSDLEPEIVETTGGAEASPPEPALSHEKADVAPNREAAESIGEPDAEGDDKQTVLNENLTEADVYIKYGHLSKANVHLEKNLDIDPTHIATHERFLKVFEEQGNTREQINTLMVLSSLYKNQEMPEKSAQALHRVLELDPGHAQALSQREGGAAAPLSDDHEAGAGEAAHFDFEVDVQGAPEPASPTEQQPQVAAVIPEPVTAPRAPAPAAGVSAESINELRDEADFYQQHGMMDEARVIYEKILASHPDRTDIAEKLWKITGGEKAAPEAQGVPADRSSSDRGQAVVSTPAGQGPSDPPPSNTGFVNFADEIRAEVDTDIGKLLSESGAEGEEADFTAELRREVEESFTSDITEFGESDVMNIFSEFREGVQREVGNEDHETHYNLGIAYLEMGLIDEACEEFMTASRDERRAMDCMTMIGL